MLIGLASSGLHANGFSLVRQALLGRYAARRRAARAVAAAGRGAARAVRDLRPDGPARSRARASCTPPPTSPAAGSPRTCRGPCRRASARGSSRGSWPVPPVFGLIAEAAGASEDDLYGTFNMGVGMVLVVAAGRRRRRAGRGGARAPPDRRGHRRRRRRRAPDRPCVRTPSGQGDYARRHPGSGGPADLRPGPVGPHETVRPADSAPRPDSRSSGGMGEHDHTRFSSSTTSRRSSGSCSSAWRPRATRRSPRATACRR